MKLEFMFDGLPVGFFEGSEYPARAGQYRYMAYRGPGHFNMQTVRNAEGRARCYYDLDGERVSFLIVHCPTQGVIQLEGFERASL